jgi:hypothetical protein
MFSYSGYGLGIRSELELPELAEAVTSVDVHIRFGNLEPIPEAELKLGNGLAADTDEVRYTWKEIGTFLARKGEEIVIDPAPGVEQQVLRLFILGRLLATILHQRGRLVLHASAVSMNGGAVAFLGGKGWGKSTLAGAMYESGHPIVTDDVLAVQTSSKSPVVYPSFPQLKLWPTAAALLGDTVERLPQLHPDFEKRARLSRRGFSEAALAIRRLYVLDEGESARIERLGHREAFIELVRHSYAVQILAGTDTVQRHFAQCARLITSVPVCRLVRPNLLAEVPRLTSIIEEDLKSAESGTSESIEIAKLAGSASSVKV